jgi:hypothetical protein
VEDNHQHQNTQQNIPNLIPAQIRTLRLCPFKRVGREPRIFRSRVQTNAGAVVELVIGSVGQAIRRTIDGVSGNYDELVPDDKIP